MQIRKFILGNWPYSVLGRIGESQESLSIRRPIIPVWCVVFESLTRGQCNPFVLFDLLILSHVHVSIKEQLRHPNFLNWICSAIFSPSRDWWKCMDQPVERPTEAVRSRAPLARCD